MHCQNFARRRHYYYDIRETKTQKDLFSKFGEVVLLDATYRTNKFKMPLFTLMVVDNFGIGQPVGVVFMKDETAANIQTALKIFASVCITY